MEKLKSLIKITLIIIFFPFFTLYLSFKKEVDKKEQGFFLYISVVILFFWLIIIFVIAEKIFPGYKTFINLITLSAFTLYISLLGYSLDKMGEQKRDILVKPDPKDIRGKIWLTLLGKKGAIKLYQWAYKPRDFYIISFIALIILIIYLFIIIAK